MFHVDIMPIATCLLPSLQHFYTFSGTNLPRRGASTQAPLYPEGHPKRIEQDSQRADDTRTKSKKKRKKSKTVEESSEIVKDPNSVSISDAETESGNDKSDASDKEEIEETAEKHTKNTKYTKEDFIARKHGKEKEPWVQKPMPFPDKKHKSRKKNTITSSVIG